jgi:hypothetical protein
MLRSTCVWACAHFLHLCDQGRGPSAPSPIPSPSPRGSSDGRRPTNRPSRAAVQFRVSARPPTDRGRRWFTPEQAEEAAGALQGYLQTYQCLAQVNLARRRPLYKCRPKMHYLEHMRLRILREHSNPRHEHNFLEEDFVGRVSRLAAKTHRANVCLRTLQRYLIFLGLRLEERRRAGRLRLAPGPG